jgi:hypothetical protein
VARGVKFGGKPKLTSQLKKEARRRRAEGRDTCRACQELQYREGNDFKAWLIHDNARAPTCRNLRLSGVDRASRTREHDIPLSQRKVSRADA